MIPQYNHPSTPISGSFWTGPCSNHTSQVNQNEGMTKAISRALLKRQNQTAQSGVHGKQLGRSGRSNSQEMAGGPKRTKQGGNLAEMRLRLLPSAIKILNTKPMACYLSFSFSSLFSFSLFIFIFFTWSLLYFSLFLFFS